MHSLFSRARSPVPKKRIERYGPKHPPTCQGTKEDAAALLKEPATERENYFRGLNLINNNAPIFCAIMKNHHECVKWYFKHCANPYGEDLVQIVFRKLEKNYFICYEVMEVIFDYIGPAGKYNGIKDESAFIKYAIQIQRYDLIEMVLKKIGVFIDMDILTKHKLVKQILPPIYIALDQYKSQDDLPIIELLVSHGATFDLGLKDQPEFKHIQKYLESNCKIFIKKNIPYEDKEALFVLLDRYNMDLNGFTMFNLQKFFHR